jgi:ribonuclease BN (tRNA processing enzyme)
MEITLLGTGTPTPSLKRASAGYLVRIGEDVIVIDHGPGAHNRLLQTGTAAADVTHVFLTHYHYDHWLDYPRLVLQRWDQCGGIRPELKVFGPAPLKRLNEQLFSEDGVYDLDILARTTSRGSLEFYKARGGLLPRPRPNPELTELESGSAAKGNGWTVTAQAVPHAGPHLQSLAYRFETPDGVYVHSGDTGVTDEFTHFCKGADLLVHMCHYYTGSGFYTENNRRVAGHMEVARTAAAAGVKTCVLTHITEKRGSAASASPSEGGASACE